MLFKENDSDNMIHLGNYEEFFILYQDNELSDEQMQQVDEFLALHPELLSEFELLLSTRLPAEEIKFANKEELLAGSMSLENSDEELLLFLDGELPAERAEVIKNKLLTDKELKSRYTILLKTKLDGTEKVTYPNKEELYRRTQKIVPFKTWMRIAAAIILIAFMGMLYWQNSSVTNKIQPNIAIKNTINKKIQPAGPIKIIQDKNTLSEKPVEQVAEIKSSIKKKRAIKKDILLTVNSNKQLTQKKSISISDESKKIITERNTIADTKLIPRSSIAIIEPSKQTINKSAVTSLLAQRTTYVASATPTKPVSIAGADQKGSFKGFLRKATRMIEKKTGIDPSNDNDELLIGAVAIKIN